MSLFFNYALRDDQYVSIDEFMPGVGAGCGCICPECGEPVRSNVTAKTRDQLKIDFRNHFSHIDENSICNGGYEETKLHLKAKEIIESHAQIFAPIQSRSNKEAIQYLKVRIERAFPHLKLKRYRPDIILETTTGTEVAIEVVVTNPVSPEKENEYKIAKIGSLVIDLSPWKGQSIPLIENELKQQIIDLTERKSWIWNPYPSADQSNTSDTENIKEQSIWSNPIPWIIAGIGALLIFPSIKNWLFGRDR